MQTRFPDLSLGDPSLAVIAQCSQRGLMVFDQGARVLAFNGSAVALLGRFAALTLRPAHGELDDVYRLTGADAALRADVEQAVVECAQAPLPGADGCPAPAARTIRLGGPRDRDPLVMRLSAVRHAEAHGHAPAVRVVGVLTCLASRPTVDALQFSRLFELSTASARVAEVYLHVDSVKDAARALGISTNTVKSHLAAVYERTGCSRQAQLVRLLMSLSSCEPARRRGDGAD